MFGDENEYGKSIMNSLLICLIDEQNEKNQILQKISEKMEATYTQRIKFIIYKSINELPFKNLNEKVGQNEKGIINMTWLNNLYNNKPSVFLLFYYFSFTSNIKNEEEKIINDIKKIKKYDELSNIMLFIIFNNSNYYFDYRKNNLKLENCFVWNTVDDINRYDIKKFSSQILHLSKDYYKKLKNKYIKRKDMVVSDEEKTKYNIKIGVVSIIKSKKNVNLNAKYFKEAYEYIKKTLINIKNYHYGKIETPKLNFFEIKSTADWIFYKILRLTSDTVSQKDQISFYYNHINKFSHSQFEEKNDNFNFFTYYWLYIRTKDFIHFLIKNYTINYEINENFIGNISLKCLYYLNQTIDFFKNNFENLNLGKINVGNKEIAFDKIKKEDSKYFGKTPLYQYQYDPLNLKKIGFNELGYIKKFIVHNQISIDKLIKEINENISKKIIEHFDQVKGLDISNINFYLSILSYFNSQKYLDNENIYSNLENIYHLIQKTKYINKYPKIILYFYSKFSDFIIKKQESVSLSLNEKKYLFEILIKLGIFRNLNENEENILFQLFNDSEFVNYKKETNKETPNSNSTPNESSSLGNINSNDKHILYINTQKNIKNSLFNFEYTIKDFNKEQSKKMLDLIEYDIKISTSLKNENIKFTSIQLAFEIENRRGKNTIDIRNIPNERFESELSKDNPLIFKYRFLVKDYNSKLFLKKVIFTLEKTPFYIYINYFSHSNDNIIFLTKFSKNILEFECPNSVKLGINEYYNFDFSLKIDQSYNIEIKDLIFEFEDNKNINNEINSPKKTNNSVSKSFHLKNQKYVDKYVSFFGMMPAQSQILNKDSLKTSSEFEIFLFNQFNNSLEETKNGTKIIIPNLESIIKEGKKSPIIMRFKEEGKYNILLKTTYKIIKKELTNDSFEYIERKLIDFEIIDPFNFKYELSCNNYISKSGKKEYPSGKNIKLELLIDNKLDSKVIIKDIKEEFVDKFKDNININLTLLNLLHMEDLDNEIKESLFSIMKSSEHSIPIDCVFLNECQEESIGNLNLIWISEKIEEFCNQYNYMLYNEYKFPFPDDIIIKNFDLDLNCDYSITNNNIILLKINIINRNNLPKRLHFNIDKSENFYLSGINKKFYLIQGNQQLDLEFQLIPTEIGYIKLPPFKVIEYPYNSNKQSDRLHSLYYFPNYITID